MSAIRPISDATQREVRRLEALLGTRYAGWAEEPEDERERRPRTFRVDVDGTDGYRGTTLRQALRLAREAAERHTIPAAVPREDADAA